MDSPLIEWETEHSNKGTGVIIPTQEEIHQELLNEFGGAYESDGEEYDNY